MQKNNFLVSGMIDLAQPRLGTKIVFKSDEFFAPANRIISPNNAVWKEGLYNENGKWMDGWETRRKRTEGYDCIILALGKPGRLSIINIDTSYFNGNQPDFASIEGCYYEGSIPKDKTGWETIVKKSKIKPNGHNVFKSKNNNVFTHIRLNIHPDGGVARLRLYGKISTEKLYFSSDDFIELSSILNGTSIITVNNEHFGKAENILAPGKALNMSDGWETRRRRTKGNDYLIFKFGIPGIINKIIVDTRHFKGNYPDYISLQAAYINENKLISKNKILNQSLKWKYLLKNEKMHPDKEHFFDNYLLTNKVVNYIKLNIFPDGGISRINIFGIKSNK